MSPSQTIDIANNIAATFLLLGLTIVYIPQFYKIYKKKSAQGLSPFFMLLGHTAAFMTAMNTLIFYIDNWWTCQNFSTCFESTIGFLLVLIQWLFFWAQYFILVYYEQKNYHSPTEEKEQLLTQDENNDNINLISRIRVLFHNKTQYLWMTITFITSMILSGITLINTLILLFLNGWKYQQSVALTTWSQIMDVIIAILFLLHYLPQIYETCKLRKAGSLSLISLAMMAPGTLVWAAFLAYQGNLVSNSKAGNPAVWFPYILVGMMQLILLCLGIHYERRRKRIENETNDLFNLDGVYESEEDELIVI